MKERRSDLRDLAERIGYLTARHPAFTPAMSVIANALAHLSAIAHLEELASGLREVESVLETDRLLTVSTVARSIYNLAALFPDFQTGSMSGGTVRIVSATGRRFKITIEQSEE